MIQKVRKGEMKRGSGQKGGGKERRKTQGRKEDDTKVEIWRRNKSECKNHCQVFEL